LIERVDVTVGGITSKANVLNFAVFWKPRSIWCLCLLLTGRRRTVRFVDVDSVPRATDGVRRPEEQASEFLILWELDFKAPEPVAPGSRNSRE
jgi:hypothetical protein